MIFVGQWTNVEFSELELGWTREREKSLPCRDHPITVYFQHGTPSLVVDVHHIIIRYPIESTALVAKLLWLQMKIDHLLRAAIILFSYAGHA